jgi:3-hydroxyacyl-CoA dehydrogenase/3-hydroxy-2-methylbutyryl-CoA dehydrogenase
MQIDGSGALVVGGASGLGEASVRRLHAGGASVLIADLNEEKGDALADELGARAGFVKADVTDAESVQAAVRAAAELPGGLRISICCAGIGWAERVASRRGPHQLQPFETVIRVNLIGTFNVLRFAAAAMLGLEPVGGSGERGVCVNTASIAAFDGQIGQVSYSASKGGIVGMTLPAARDLAVAGIRV